MQITLTLTDMLVAAGIIVPLACTGLYLTIRGAIKSAVSSAVKDLKLEVTERFVTQDTCRQIRAECERHRDAEARRAHA